MARLRAVALKEMEQKLRAILMKRKKIFFFALFTKLYQRIKRLSSCIVCICGWLICNIMGLIPGLRALGGNRGGGGFILSYNFSLFVLKVEASLSQGSRPQRT